MTSNELRRAAEVVRIAAIAEHARLIGDTATVDRILDGVDPRDCDFLAAALEREAGLRAGIPRRERVTRTRTRTPW